MQQLKPQAYVGALGICDGERLKKCIQCNVSIKLPLNTFTKQTLKVDVKKTCWTNYAYHHSLLVYSCHNLGGTSLFRMRIISCISWRITVSLTERESILLDRYSMLKTINYYDSVLQKWAGNWRQGSETMQIYLPPISSHYNAVMNLNDKWREKGWANLQKGTLNFCFKSLFLLFVQSEIDWLVSFLTAKSNWMVLRMKSNTTTSCFRKNT